MLQFIYNVYEGLVQVSYRRPEIPLAFVPLTNVIGDRPELQEGNVLLQAGIVKGSSFHALNNGSYILLIPVYTCSIRADLVDGEGPDGRQAGEVEPVLMGIDQQA